MLKENHPYAIEFENITKDFPGIRANDNVSFKVKAGSIHALIGENGAGKSTLMSILFGLYEPTIGTIKVNGNTVFIKNPNEANFLGLGMVHQHFKLVDVYSNLDNIIMGAEVVNKGFLNRDSSIQKIQTFQNVYNLQFDLKQITGKANVATQQKVEIMKMLYRDANILIFDEPTAVLTTQEIQGLLKTMLDFKAQGKTIIFISHKLKEIKQVADAATILRHGKVVKNYDDLTDVSIEDMSKAMVGDNVKHIQNVDRIDLSERQVIFEFDKVSTKGTKPITDVSFKVHAGEILAIAGVEGNGQEEIELAAYGLKKVVSGNIYKTNTLKSYDNKHKNSDKNINENNKIVNLTKLAVIDRWKNGISYIAGDRHKYAMTLDMNVNDNSIIRLLKDSQVSKHGWIINKFKNSFTQNVIKEFDVRGARNGISLARSLSGGNQQKFVVGREMMTQHDFIIVVQPTRGLDVGAITKIHEEILKEKAQGKAILLISYELDEILALADRILVVSSGKVVDTKNKDEITREAIGLMMAGIKQEEGVVNE